MLIGIRKWKRWGYLVVFLAIPLSAIGIVCITESDFYLHWGEAIYGPWGAIIFLIVAIGGATAYVTPDLILYKIIKYSRRKAEAPMDGDGSEENG